MSIVDTSFAPAKTRVVVSNGRARRDRLLLAEEIGLVVDRLNGPAGREARLDRRGLFGNDRRAPVFVGEAKPAAVALEGVEPCRSPSRCSRR